MISESLTFFCQMFLCVSRPRVLVPSFGGGDGDLDSRERETYVYMYMCVYVVSISSPMFKSKRTLGLTL